MRITTILSFIGATVAGLADVFFWIQVFRTTEQKRRRFLTLAITFVFIFTSAALGAWSRVDK